MKGLVYKDLINVGQQWESYLLILVFWGGLSIMQKNPYFFGGMFSVYMVVVLLTAYSYDEKSGWDKYALTMPVSRSRIVLSKYVLGLLMSILGFATVCVFFAVSGTDIGEMITAQCIFQTISFVLLAFQIPVTLKFGVEKARFTVAFVILVPVLMAYMAAQAGIPLPDFERLMRFVYLGPVAGLCLLAVSAAVSVQIYRRKEF